MNEANRNLLQGTLAAIWYALVSIVIPLYIIGAAVNYQVSETLDFAFTPEEFARLQYWIIAFGSILTATVFVRSGAPPWSTRKAIMDIVFIIFNTFYFYVYNITGFSDLTFDISPIPGFNLSFSLDVSRMIYMIMGITALNILIAVYDLGMSIWSPYKVEGEYTEKDHEDYKEQASYGRYLDD